MKTVQNVEEPYFKYSNISIYIYIYKHHQRTQHGATVGKPVEYFKRMIPVSKEKWLDKAAN
jgi:hypothetical protein